MRISSFEPNATAGREPAIPHVALLVDTALESGRGTLSGIVAFTRQYGAWLTFHEPRDIEHLLPDWIANWRGHGIIARIQNVEMRRLLARTGLPVVDVLGASRGSPFPLVHVDDAAIARLAAGHLLDQGFSSFGFCHMTGQPWSLVRRDAFRQHLKHAGHPCACFNMAGDRFVQYAWETEQVQLATWLLSLRKPVGIMICSDWRGQAVLVACRRAGLRVPDDVALVGVDNDTTLCEACEPPLSSVQCDYHRVGFEAARLLARWMAGERPSGGPLRVPPRGVKVRRSSDTLAIEEGHVAQAVRLIRQHACAGISVEEVVRRVPCSRTALQREFKAVLGRSMHDELLGVKLDAAMFLLRESNLSIADIAERCGFGSQAYLGAALKTHRRTTPLHYRRLWDITPRDISL
jgi:LacI family transcriptional regulator